MGDDSAMVKAIGLASPVGFQTYHFRAANRNKSAKLGHVSKPQVPPKQARGSTWGKLNSKADKSKKQKTKEVRLFSE